MKRKAQAQQDATQKAVCRLVVPLVSELRTSNSLGRCQLWSTPQHYHVFPSQAHLKLAGKGEPEVNIAQIYCPSALQAVSKADETPHKKSSHRAGNEPTGQPGSGEPSDGDPPRERDAEQRSP